MEGWAQPFRGGGGSLAQQACLGTRRVPEANQESGPDILNGGTHSSAGPPVPPPPTPRPIREHSSSSSTSCPRQSFWTHWGRGEHTMGGSCPLWCPQRMLSGPKREHLVLEREGQPSWPMGPSWDLAGQGCQLQRAWGVLLVKRGAAQSCVGGPSHVLNIEPPHCFCWGRPSPAKEG